MQIVFGLVADRRGRRRALLIGLIDILGTEADDVVEKVQLKIERSKIYKNLDILDDREKEVVVGRFGFIMLFNKKN